MCGLVGYVGKKNCINQLFETLKKLEYRGYDSAGIATLSQQSFAFFVAKTVGEVDKLKPLLEKNCSKEASIGIGQTRWATHGGVTVENAHPHADCSGSSMVAHNGIIENYKELKTFLMSLGHNFLSSTDTEVVAHLFEHEIAQKKTIEAAWKATVSQLQGAYALVALNAQIPNTIFIARHKSPLYIGINQHQHIIASDPGAFDDETMHLMVAPDNSYGTVTQEATTLYTIADDKLLAPALHTFKPEQKIVQKNTYSHEMVREIFEEPTAIKQTIIALEANNNNRELIQVIDWSNPHARATFIGCGTSWHAAGFCAEALKNIAHVPSSATRASEFRYEPYFADTHNGLFFISQSGETADTLEALRFSKTHGAHTVAITNVVQSSIAHETDYVIETTAGREVAVASTKAFLAQMTAGLWYAYQVAKLKQIPEAKLAPYAPEAILTTAQQLAHILQSYAKPLETIYAPYYASFERFLFVGRGVGYWVAAEAALKLKEISYCFAEAHPAGELKHGVIALIDPKTPTCLISSTDSLLYKKLISTAHEIKSRNGHLLVIAAEGQKDLIELADTALIVPHLPPLLFPIAATGLLHLFAYYCALQKNCPIDKPRNLAKSVTVE